MRKIISVLLVTLMLFSVVAVSASAADGCDCLTEENARKTGVFISESTELMPMFLKYE